MFMGSEEHFCGVIRQKQMNRKVEEILQCLNLKIAASLSILQQ